jgi:hypothetical protein
MPTPATAANTIATILPYLSAITSAVAHSTHTPADVTSKIMTAMDDVRSGVSALASSETTANSEPIVDRIEADAQAVLQVAASVPLPPPFHIILMVASSLMPTVVGAVKLLMATHTTVPTPA